MLEPSETMHRAQICLADKDTKNYAGCVVTPMKGNCRIELKERKIIIGEWPGDIEIILPENIFVDEIHCR